MVTIHRKIYASRGALMWPIYKISKFLATSKLIEIILLPIKNVFDKITFRTMFRRLFSISRNLITRTTIRIKKISVCF